ncbi:MAG: OmpA family protein [Geobacteraceae bacterium]|nr:OmpA family protein [Geobacteraceae bacterium]
MKTSEIVLFGLAVLMCLAACSRDRCTVVLLPEPDGKTGQLLISNLGGSQLLQEPKQSTSIQSAETAPAAPAVMADQEINNIFGAALSALPSPPIHFMLYFKTGTTELTNQSQNLLVEILPAIADRNSTDVSIVGHTDRVGSREDNYRLALERALLIQKSLLSLGINPQFIEVTSHGEDNPLIITKDEIAERRNRRVEVVVR